MSVHGTIYLLHFSKKLKGTRHYLGWAHEGKMMERIERHKKGQGAKITRAAVKNGARLSLVKTWEGDRHLERKLKNRRNHAALCPLCQKQHAKKNATQKRKAAAKRKGLQEKLLKSCEREIIKAVRKIIKCLKKKKGHQ